MENLASRKVLVCILSMMLPVAAFGQQTAKDLFKGDAHVQTANAYLDMEVAKQRKGDLPGAITDYNQAIKLRPKYAFAYNNLRRHTAEHCDSGRSQGLIFLAWFRILWH